jgi:hypothetical protein
MNIIVCLESKLRIIAMDFGFFHVRKFWRYLELVNGMSVRFYSGQPIVFLNKPVRLGNCHDDVCSVAAKPTTNKQKQKLRISKIYIIQIKNKWNKNTFWHTVNIIFMSKLRYLLKPSRHETVRSAPKLIYQNTFLMNNKYTHN